MNEKLYNGKSVKELYHIFMKEFDNCDLNSETTCEKEIEAVAQACTPRWIPVGERLPLPKQKVLGAWPYGVVITRYFPAGHFSHANISHWMPLPKMPERIE